MDDFEGVIEMKYAPGHERHVNTAGHRIPALGAIASELGTMIYAARLQDGIIKIGWTNNLQQRLGNLGVGFHALLALTPGGYDEEQAIHRTLVAHRARGREYYYPTPEVLAVVNDMRSRYGLSLLAA